MQMPSSSLHPEYDIRFMNETIKTLVTSSGSDVDRWIKNTISPYAYREEKSDSEFIIVGLDTEWRLATRFNKYQQVAVLQLSIDRSCLIFQLYQADYIPKSLVKFLGDDRFCFVGKEVKTDAQKLFDDYNLSVKNVKDVAHWAADKCDDEAYRRMGLKNLVLKFLKQEMEKDKRITLSRWDVRSLNFKQIKYATIDAFVSYKLGVYLRNLSN